MEKDRYDRITGRPWKGKCATTELTMDEFLERLSHVQCFDWVARASVSICRAYGIKGLADPAYIANVIKAEFDRDRDSACGSLTRGEAEEEAKDLRGEDR